MWYDGKRGFGLSRIKRWLRAEDHTLTRDLGDMFIDTCPVEVWNGASMQEVYDRLQAYRRGDEQPRSTDEELVFDSFPDELDDAEFFMHLLRRFDMELYWYTYGANTDPEALEGLVMDDQMLPGFSDSGAHITNMAFYDVNLRALRMAQRSSLERVAYTVRRLTREPAEFFGIEAGGIDEGDVADVILVDPKALSRYESESHTASIYRDAFEHHQLVNRSDGVVPIVVKGGRVVFEDGDFAEQLGRERVGRALRRARA
jgi:N-acyl-D-aspartate/D-glutamate deacylase